MSTAERPRTRTVALTPGRRITVAQWGRVGGALGLMTLGNDLELVVRRRIAARLRDAVESVATRTSLSRQWRVLEHGRKLQGIEIITGKFALTLIFKPLAVRRRPGVTIIIRDGRHRAGTTNGTGDVVW